MLSPPKSAVAERAGLVSEWGDSAAGPMRMDLASVYCGCRMERGLA